MNDFTWRRIDLAMLIGNTVDNACLWLARRLPLTLRRWIVIKAFADTSIALATKHREEIGYKNVMDHMR